MAENDEVRLGMRVRDVHGDVLGTVVRLGAGRFLVQNGTVIKESVIVPDKCVAAVNEGEIVLTCGYRDLIQAMQNPPMEVERERQEVSRYAEPAPVRGSAPAADSAASRGGVESLTERPGKVRVVREEFAVSPGSAHEFQVRPREDEPAKEADLDVEADPDRPVH